ncbi:hypothetical protein CLU79DRAFT_114674 [Phycomyces nitens]|nr:hypothetical protein CLU79DRAFT_114674 [Phycomyces nitens]
MSSKDDLPFIIFVPLILCLLGIGFLLSIRREQQTQLTHPLEAVADENEAGDPAEGSSSATRIRKIGKKRGEKLKRKEQKRQYQEYLQQLNEARKAQDQRLEEEYRQHKLEESIRRADELDQLRKTQAKNAKREQDEKQKKTKEEEREQKRKETRFVKYSEKIKLVVKKLKVCTMEEVGLALGMEPKDCKDMLEEVCGSDPQFSLCLWTEDTFMFVTEEDYGQLKEYASEHGKLSVKEAVEQDFFLIP